MLIYISIVQTIKNTLASIALCVAIVSCSSPEEEPDYVARLGDSHLLKEEVDFALENIPMSLDSLQAKTQVIDNWVRNELLLQEAKRIDLTTDPEVRSRLRDSERSILVSWVISQLHERAEEPSEAEIRTYYQNNLSKLSVREPFLRVRFLSTKDSLSAVNARGVLVEINDSNSPDSLWQSYIDRFAVDREASSTLSANYYPASRLLRSYPGIFRLLQGRTSSFVGPLVKEDGEFQVFQLVDQVKEGATPKLDWIREEISNILWIRQRKQLVTQEVQKLRNKALSSGDLRIK